jgi:hypothetical protein
MQYIKRLSSFLADQWKIIMLPNRTTTATFWKESDEITNQITYYFIGFGEIDVVHV